MGLTMPTKRRYATRYIAIVGSISAGRGLGIDKHWTIGIEKLRCVRQGTTEARLWNCGLRRLEDFVDVHVVRGYVDGIATPNPGSIRLYTQSNVHCTFPIGDAKTPLPVDWLDIKPIRTRSGSCPTIPRSEKQRRPDDRGAQSTLWPEVLCLRNNWPILTIAETAAAPKQLGKAYP